jgi:hypothetical protein
VLLALTLLPAVHAATDCEGPSPEQAAVTLETARADFKAAHSRVNDTEWQYRLAIEDRDTVLADRDDAYADLRAARSALRDAKKGNKEAEQRLARCGPTSPAA